MTPTPPPDLAVACDLCQTPTARPRHLTLCPSCYGDLIEQATGAASDRRRPPLLTVSQVAALLGLNPQVVRRLIRSGELEAVNVAAASNGHGQRYRVARKALRRYLARKRRHRLIVTDL